MIDLTCQEWFILRDQLRRLSDRHRTTSHALACWVPPENYFTDCVIPTEAPLIMGNFAWLRTLGIPMVLSVDYGLSDYDGLPIAIFGGYFDIRRHAAEECTPESDLAQNIRDSIDAAFYDFSFISLKVSHLLWPDKEHRTKPSAYDRSAMALLKWMHAQLSTPDIQADDEFDFTWGVMPLPYDLFSSCEQAIVVASQVGAKAPVKTRPRDSLSPLDQALAILVSHPEWTNKQIAKEVGVHEKTLSKPTWKKFQDARTIARGGRTLPKGFNGRNGLESYSEEERDGDE